MRRASRRSLTLTPQVGNGLALIKLSLIDLESNAECTDLEPSEFWLRHAHARKERPRTSPVASGGERSVGRPGQAGGQADGEAGSESAGPTVGGPSRWDAVDAEVRRCLRSGEEGGAGGRAGLGTMYVPMVDPKSEVVASAVSVGGGTRMVRRPQVAVAAEQSSVSADEEKVAEGEGGGALTSQLKQWFQRVEPADPAPPTASGAGVGDEPLPPQDRRRNERRFAVAVQLETNERSTLNLNALMEW